MVEILLLSLFLGVLFIYGQIAQRIEKLETSTSLEEFNEEQLEINESAPRMTGYRTFALFGLDHRRTEEGLLIVRINVLFPVQQGEDVVDVICFFRRAVFVQERFVVNLVITDILIDAVDITVPLRLIGEVRARRVDDSGRCVPASTV